MRVAGNFAALLAALAVATGLVAGCIAVDEEPALSRGLIDTRMAPPGGILGGGDRIAGISRAREYLAAAMADHGRSLGDPIHVRIFKESAELEIWSQRPGGGPDSHPWTHIATYDICSYSGDLGPKLQTGDWQSPEGLYRVTRGQLNPNSSYHLSFDLGFPNELDRSRGRTGSYLMVHGDCESIGCYAMTNGGIEEIYAFAEAALTSGQDHFRVDIFPARLTDPWLAERSESPWHQFWSDLQMCYERFEHHGVVADDRVANARYVCG